MHSYNTSTIESIDYRFLYQYSVNKYCLYLKQTQQFNLEEIAGDDGETSGMICDAAQAGIIQEHVGEDFQEELQRELVEEVHL